MFCICNTHLLTPILLLSPLPHFKDSYHFQSQNLNLYFSFLTDQQQWTLFWVYLCDLSPCASCSFCPFLPCTAFSSPWLSLYTMIVTCMLRIPDCRGALTQAPSPPWLKNKSTKTWSAWGGDVADLSKEKGPEPSLHGFLLGSFAQEYR